MKYYHVDLVVLKSFELNINKNKLFNKTDHLLVAFSGGVDSVVLSDLLLKAGYGFDMAHCNFQLRGNESHDDHFFCERYAQSIQAKCHVIGFNTKDYALQHKLSIQMAARKLRYDWFNELIVKYGYTHVLTAHHADDHIETLLVNLIRGTGIKGLQGIPEKQGFVVRPLLFASKQEIKDYALKQGLVYREDSSNQEVKYKRNFIRHRIIPELKTLNPSLQETMLSSIHYFRQASEIVTEFAALKYQKIVTEERQQVLIDIGLLRQEEHKETLLFEWLSHKGFNASHIQSLIQILDSEQRIGKSFMSATHQLVIDRQFLIVQPLTKKNDPDSFIIRSLSDTEHLPIQLRFEESDNSIFSNHAYEITIPYHDHLFPLTLRRWKPGDTFKPFGMKGFKKLSDFFKDQKLSLFEKKEVWILENKAHIIWVVGHRVDERCRISEASSKKIKISLVLGS